MTKGASVPDQALAVPVEPVSRLDPSGFDPSRGAIQHIIYRLIRGIPIQPVVNFKGKHLFDRYEFWRWDEWPDKFVDRHKASCNCEHCPIKKGCRPRRLPWWLPFNAFLHHWNPERGATEEFHDHPRWSVTVCLTGRIIEQTPWGERLLRPGSIVLRRRSAIHKFKLLSDAGEVWTLFIVGRRCARQNTYKVTGQ